MSDKKITGFRICRAQRCTDSQFRFTLPINGKIFHTAAEAFNEAKIANAFRFADSYFDIQILYGDGTVSEYPKSLQELGVDVPKEPEPIEDRPAIVIEQTEGNFKVDSSLIKKRSA